MGLPDPNVLISVGKRGRASVEVGGVKMAGVVRVSADHAMDGGNVIIEISPHYARFEQRPNSLPEAEAQITRRMTDILNFARASQQEADHLQRENDDLRQKLSERQRYRVQAGRREA